MQRNMCIWTALVSSHSHYLSVTLSLWSLSLVHGNSRAVEYIAEFFVFSRKTKIKIFSFIKHVNLCDPCIFGIYFLSMIEMPKEILNFTRKQECIPVGCVPPAAVAVRGVSTRHPTGTRPTPGPGIPSQTRHPPGTRHTPPCGQADRQV